MPTSVPGSPERTPPRRHSARNTPSWACGSLRGFTLLELLVVVTLVALATAGVSLALRDPSTTQLEREAQRQAALLDAARAHSRAMGIALYWRTSPGGFEVNGQFRPWLTPGTQATLSVRGAQASRLVLGPEPLLPPQTLALSVQGRTLSLSSDGLRPFQVQTPAP